MEVRLIFERPESWCACECFLAYVLARSHLGTMSRKVVGRTTGLRNGIGDPEMQKDLGRPPQAEDYQISSVETELKSGFSFKSPLCIHVPWNLPEVGPGLSPYFWQGLLLCQSSWTAGFWGFSCFCLPPRHETSGITDIDIITLAFHVSSADPHLGPHTRLTSTLSIKPSHQSQSSVSKNMTI